MYLVDGNNVIGQRPGWHRDRSGARQRLLREMAELGRRRGFSITVVFDGAPDPHYPEGSRHGRVRIYYALRGSDADSRIIDLVEAEANRRSLVVVTSDRDLANRVRVCGVRVMRSGDFRQWLDALPTTAVDSPRVAPGEANEWMRYFGVDDEEPDDLTD